MRPHPDGRPPVLNTPRPWEVYRYGPIAELLRWSLEVDYGVWWWAGDVGAPWSPPWSLRWAEDGGVLYVVQAPMATESRCEVIAWHLTRRQADAALEGWADECGRPRSLAWVYQSVGRWVGALTRGEVA